MQSKIRLSRMVGGVPSAHGIWPWQAGLYRLDEKTGEINSLCFLLLNNNKGILKYSIASFNHIIPASSPLHRIEVKITQNIRKHTCV